jgi:hypothetical protein
MPWVALLATLDRAATPSVWVKTRHYRTQGKNASERNGTSRGLSLRELWS